MHLNVLRHHKTEQDGNKKRGYKSGTSEDHFFVYFFGTSEDQFHKMSDFTILQGLASTKIRKKVYR